MPKVSQASAPQLVSGGPVRSQSKDLDGYTLEFAQFHQDADATPLLKGLPDDLCQSPHWGYVFKGRVAYRYPGREEVVEAGEAFYVPPGHTALAAAGTEILHFSPTAQIRLVNEVMQRNMEAMAQKA